MAAESDRLADAVRSLLRGASQSASYPATARVNAAALARVRVALATYDDLRNPPVSVPYEPCVLDADGRCARWSRDHSSDVTSSPGQHPSHPGGDQ